MSDQIQTRILATLIFAILGLAAWRLIGHLVLRKVRSSAPDGFRFPAGFVPGLPGLLVFGSPDCRTCASAQKPAVRSVAERLGKAIQVLEVDVSAHPELAEHYGVLSLPTIFVLDRTGSPQKVNHGFVPPGELHRQLEPYLIA